MKSSIKQFFAASLFCRAMAKVGAFFSRFWRSSVILGWFVGEQVDGSSRSDRWMQKLVDGKVGDFIRSSCIVSLLMKIKGLPWWLLMATLLSAMALPTLAVMLLSLCTLAAAILSVFCRKQPLPHINGGIRVWCLFALMTLVFTFVNYGGMSGVLAGGIRFTMILLVPATWLVLYNKERVWNTLYVFGVGVLGVAGYGIWQYFGGNMSAKWTDTKLFSEEFGRLTATFENPNVYGTFLLIAVPVLLMATIFGKGLRLKIFFGFTTALATVNLFLTYSRGCYTALLLILLILLFCRGKAFLWLGLGALAASPLYLPDSVWQRVASIGNMADSSVTFRMSIWQGSVAMISKYWWMGVGIGESAFTSIFQSVAVQSTEDVSHAHNLFLQIACESGILGLIILILFFVYVFRSALSAMRGKDGFDRWMRLTILACWCGLLLQGMTDYIFYNNNLVAIMMISLGAMVSCIGGKEGKNE